MASFRVSGNPSKPILWHVETTIILVGSWEVIQKLGLDEELLKVTELRRTDDPGNFRRHILAITTDS